MKRMAALVVALCLALTGCQGDFLPYARDIEAIELLRTLGVDAAEDGEELVVTVSSGVQHTGAGGQADKPVVFSQTGQTIYEACNTIQTFSDAYIFFGHVTEWVLGEDVARRGMTNLVDYMERDAQMRLNTKVFVVKDGRAEDLLKGLATDAAAATDRLSAIELDYQLKSIAYPYTVKELLSQMEENGCGLVPALVLEDKQAEQNGDEQGGRPASFDAVETAGSGQGEGQGKESVEGEEKSVRSVGYGYFKDNRLAGFLDEDASRGVNLLLNQVRNGTVQVEMPDGGVVALRIVKSRCDWIPQMEKGVLTGMTARLAVDADVAEVWRKNSPEDAGMLELLQQELDRAVKELAEQALEISQREQADFLHLERSAAIEQPWFHSELEEHWDEWFPNLDFAVEVDGTVKRSYDISNPMKEPGEKETE